MNFSRSIETLKHDPRVTVRRDGAPDSGGCVVYWMQRSQRAMDNPALDTAVAAANLLGKPVVVFLAPVPFYPNSNLRHLAFLQQGIPDIADGLKCRHIGFVLRHYPEHNLLNFCNEVQAALVVGDENPLREPELWRRKVARRLRVPFWTVDGDVIVPTKLMAKEQYSARTMRPRIQAHLDRFLASCLNLSARIPWTNGGLGSLPPDFDITQGWALDRAVQPVMTSPGGTKNGLELLRRFVRERLEKYSQGRNHPELEGTSRLSPYLHFGHLGPHTIALAVREAAPPLGEREAFLRAIDRTPRAGHQLRALQCELRFVGVHRALGRPVFRPASQRSAAGHLQRPAVRERRDPRPIVECGAAPDGNYRLDAQPHAYVLGEEDPRVEPVGGSGVPYSTTPERPL